MAALDGVLVIAIEQAVAAPYCTQKLADAGARVIKIERAGGETARHYDEVVGGTSSYFAWLNRGKESTVLNLKDTADLDILHAMLAKADVLVQNLAPGALDRMGLTTEVLAERFPQLITVSIMGYGQDTPYAGMKAYDMLVQAEAGVCAVTGTPDTPSKVGAPLADLSTGTNAFAAVLEALIARGQTGLGASIEISMFDGLADWMTVPLLHYEHANATPERFGLAHAAIYPYRPFACRDGTIIIAVQTAAEWERLCREVVQRADLAEDPRYDSNSKRHALRAELDARLEPIFLEMTYAEAQARCATAKIAWAQYCELPDLSAHPALRRCTATLADGTETTLPRPVGRADVALPRKVPALGAQTNAIRGEFGPANEVKSQTRP